MNGRLVPINGATSAAAAAPSASNSTAGHRQKLDLIRSSLQPFEQKWHENGKEGEEEEEHDDEDEDEFEETTKAEMMIKALVEAGYDKESAFYALKLVNFRSVMEAINVLASIKKTLVRQHFNSGTGQHQQQHALNGTAASVAGFSLVDLHPASTQNGLHNLNNSPSSRPLFSVNGSPWPQQKLSHAKSNPAGIGQSPARNVRPIHRTPTTLLANSKAAPAGPSQGHALRQSQSFGPADAFQVGKPLGTVIRIERNQSERTAAAKMPEAKPQLPQTQQLQQQGQHWQNGEAHKKQQQHQQIAMATGPSTSSSSFSPLMGSPQPVQRIFIDPQLELGELEVPKSPPPPPPPDYFDNYNNINNRDNQNQLNRSRVPIGRNQQQQQQQQQQQRMQMQMPFSMSPSPPPPLPHVPMPNRSVSPLPEFVAKHLKAGNYERIVKPCRAPMFRFFMEQHIEKLTQQYHERNKRARQLSHEMEAAGLATNVKDNMLRLLRQKESKYLRMKRQKMNREMFELIRHIGIGAFGKVTLVRKRDTDQVYAMKTLVKADVIQKQQAAHVKAERDILAEANSPWIVKLFFSFQDIANLYFIMEYVPGGDMMQLLINMGIFPESLARFYTAELTLAVEYVHSLGFIHRDIKPDNILIDKGGHIKLTDFGLCTGLRWTHDKRHYVVYEEQQNGGQSTPAHLRDDSFSLPPGLDQRVKVLELRHHRKRDQAHSVVGTGNYMAPEVIQRIGHTQLCDWWSVGVILYEMVYGRPPFMSQRDDPGETQYMIVHWRRFLDLNNPMGARLSRNCVDCISRLCCDQEMRMGQKAGAKDIKGHPWFRGIDFANLRQITPEFVPKVRHPEDTSNFDTFELGNDEQTKGGGGGGGGRPLAPNFIDFTFRHFFSEGMGPPMGRSQQQRPSLAPLMESAANQRINNNGRTATTAAAETNSRNMLIPNGPRNPGEKSPLSARTILKIGGPQPPSKQPLFRPRQARLEEEEADVGDESQC